MEIKLLYSILISGCSTFEMFDLPREASTLLLKFCPWFGSFSEWRPSGTPVPSKDYGFRVQGLGFGV